MDNLETLKRGAEVQIAEIDRELSHLIAAGLTHGARAISLAAQRSKLIAVVHELDEAIRETKAEEIERGRH